MEPIERSRNPNSPREDSLRRKYRYSFAKVPDSVSLRIATFIGARIIMTGLAFSGFLISGLTERNISIFLTLEESPRNSSGNGTVVGRRYCDPPNMTAMAIYYDSDEEYRDYYDGYDFSQLQEMSFQAKLTLEEYFAISLEKSYHWGTLVSPLPAAHLIRNIGAKRVFGYSLLGSAAATLLVPAAWLTPSHVIIRFFHGLFDAALVPACHTLAVGWFVRDVRSSFVSWYSGRYLGFALSDILARNGGSYLGRDFAFHLNGLVTIVWFVFWSVFVYNTPEKSSKLSAEAKRKLKMELSEEQSSSAEEIPWKHIFGSRPVWMCAGVIFGSHCGQTTTNTGVRQYLKHVYRISEDFPSTVPLVVHVSFALACGYAVDYLQKTKFVSVTSSRRIFVYISHFLPAAFIFVLSFVGCNERAPLFLYYASIVAGGAAYSGALCSAIDVAPAFAPVIVSLCTTFGALGDLLIVYTVSQVLDGQVSGSWRITFSMTSLILLVTSILFMLRGSGSVQLWNDLAKAKSFKCSDRRVTIQTSADPSTSIIKSKNKVSVEEKILKVLHVQEPERFTRVRAYSTSLPYENTKMNPRVPQILLDKKRASIS